MDLRHYRAIKYGALVAVLLLAGPVLASGLPVALVWGIVPTLVTLGLVVVSVWSIGRRSSAVQVLLGTIVIALSIVSLWTLKRMFFERAWPTYLPYLGIAVATPIVAVQAYLARRT